MMKTHLIYLFSILFLILSAPSKVYASPSVIQAKFSYKGNVFADAQIVTFTSANGRGVVSFEAAYEQTFHILYVLFTVTEETTVDSEDDFELFLDLNHERSSIPDTNDWYFLVRRDGVKGDGQYDKATGRWTGTANYPVWIYLWISNSTALTVLMAIQMTISDNQMIGLAIGQYDASPSRYVTYPEGVDVYNPSTWSDLAILMRSGLISISSSASTFQLNDEIALTAIVTPATSNGTIAFQYSKDGGDWISLASGKPSNGSYSSKWAPTATASRYQIRTVWSGDEAYRNATSTTLLFNHLTVSSAYGTPRGDAWYLNGSKAGFAITPSIVDHGNTTRRIFSGWAGDSTLTTGEGSVTMDSPKTVTAKWKTQYQLTIDSGGGEASGEGWYDRGTAVSLAATSPSKTIEEQSRLMFTGWSGDSTSTSTKIDLTMGRPYSLTANWKTQYYVKIDAGAGVVNRTSQWLDSGASLAIEATTPSKVVTDKSRIVFTGWSGALTSTASKATVTIDTYKTLKANWKNQYYLKVSSEYGEPKGEAWYDEGATASVSVTSPVGILVQQVFVGWSGDSAATTSTASLTINSPKAVTAKWTTDYTQLIVLGAGIVVVIGATIFASRKRRK